MRGPGEVLVVGCYELGRQPATVASALGALEAAGFAPASLDVSVEALDDARLRAARLVAISTPMHTALRLGLRVAARAREVRPDAPIVFFGLYAALHAQHLLERHGDFCIGGEAPPTLAALASTLDSGGDGTSVPGVATRASPVVPPPLRVRAGALPSRRGLPALQSYARLETATGERLVANVEASRGCKHLCRHCPVVPVYRGRFVALPLEAVLADVEQQVAAGARHVSFADPDFLNGPTHAVRVARALHERFPEVTFDATVKIEHLLQHRALLPGLAAAGCLFVVSAVESLNDAVLAALAKGHTAADVVRALDAARAAGLFLRPTLLPYTPWSRLEDLPALFDFAEQHGLVDAIDPVQFTLRLLVPTGSLLLEGAAPPPWVTGPSPDGLGVEWRHPDPRVDALWDASARLAAEATAQGRPAREIYLALRRLAGEAVGRSREGPLPPRRDEPRVSEPWFC